MGWTEIHNAVHAAVVLGSGFPADKVIWKYQNANAPALPYIAMKFTTSRTKGQDYKAYDYDVARPSGQEIRVSVKGTREVVLEIECFTDSTADSSDAMSLADLIKSSLLLDGVRNLLAAVSLSPFDPGEVGYIPDVPSIRFRGRATLSIRCYVPATLATEFVGYITSFGGELQLKGGRDGDFSLPYEIPKDP